MAGVQNIVSLTRTLRLVNYMLTTLKQIHCYFCRKDSHFFIPQKSKCVICMLKHLNVNETSTSDVVNFYRPARGDKTGPRGPDEGRMQSVVTRWTKQAFSCSKFLSPGGQLWANTAFEGSQFYSIGVPKFYSWVNVISVYA